MRLPDSSPSLGFASFIYLPTYQLSHSLDKGCRRVSGGKEKGKGKVSGDERGSIVGLASLSALDGVCIVYSRTHDHGTGWIRRQKKTATNPPWSG